GECRLRRAVLAERALARQLLAAEREDIAAFGFDAVAVGSGAAIDPFRKATIAEHAMLRAGPADIRHRAPDRLEGGLHIGGADDAATEHLRPDRGVEYHIVGHAGHHACTVVAIEGFEQTD